MSGDTFWAERGWIFDKYCQNPLCGAEAVKEVKVSVEKASDGERSLCACCEEVFVWLLTRQNNKRIYNHAGAGGLTH